MNIYQHFTIFGPEVLLFCFGSGKKKKKKKKKYQHFLKDFEMEQSKKNFAERKISKMWLNSRWWGKRCFHFKISKMKIFQKQKLCCIFLLKIKLLCNHFFF
jgi:hypothetical protein